MNFKRISNKLIKDLKLKINIFMNIEIKLFTLGL